LSRNLVGRRALGIALLASSALLLASTAALYLVEYRRRLASVEADARSLFEAQAPGIVEALWDYDAELARILADSMRNYPFIEYVALRDEEGGLIESGKRRPGAARLSYPLRKDRGGGASVAVGELALEIDRPRILAEAGRQALVSAALQALLLAASSAIVLALFDRMVTRHLSAIAARMDRLEPGGRGPPLSLDKREVGDELDVLVASFNAMRENLDSAAASERRAMEELARSLREKETLLQEVYHRTKNNMQMIASFLSLEAAASEDEGLRATLAGMIGRITSMALVHKKLYESRDLSRIDLGDYLRDLVAEIGRACLAERAGIGIELEAEGGTICALDAAIPCGLAVNELAVNAARHAFPGGRPGRIRVGLARKAGGDVELSVADDGIGLPPGFDFRRDGGLGLQTVLSLVEGQLRGRLSLGPGPGTSWTAEIGEAALGLPRP